MRVRCFLLIKPKERMPMTREKEVFFPNIREITNRDAIKAGAIVFKNTNLLKPHLKKLKENKDQDQIVDVAFAIISEMGPQLGKEAYDLFLDIVGLSKDEFEMLPLRSNLELEEKLNEMNDLAAFFKRVSRSAAKALDTEEKQSAPLTTI